MAGINKVILIGNLGADPEVKTFSDGGKIANISIATSDRWTDRQTGEPREATEWHRIVFNGRIAEIVEQYLRKGSKVYVEGSLRTRKWTDREGIERYSTEIRADSMQMLDSRSGGSNERGGTTDGYSNNRFESGNYNSRNTGGGYRDNAHNNQTHSGGYDGSHHIKQNNYHAERSPAKSFGGGEFENYEKRAPLNNLPSDNVDDEDMPF